METKLRTENKMGTMPVGRLLANMALPMVISMLVQALYNVVDSVYVSRVSENALTAVSMAFPIQNLMIGFSTGVGVGMNSLLSKCLGSREYDRGNLTAGNGLVLSGICCLLFMLFGAFGAGVFFRVQTDNIVAWAPTGNHEDGSWGAGSVMNVSPVECLAPFSLDGDAGSTVKYRYTSQ